MIKKIAWNTFKNTGNINTFLEFKQIEEIEKINSENKIMESQINREKRIDDNGEYKDKGNSFIRM